MRLILLAALSLSGAGRAWGTNLASTNFTNPTQNYNSGGGTTTSTNFGNFANVGDVIGQTASANFGVDAGHIYTLFGMPLPAGCDFGYNVKQDGTQDSITIQGAVNSLPSVLPGNACIVIRDAATYSEQVTVQGIATGPNFRITIMSDPTFVSSAPFVNPPQFSTAAFQIMNASVTLQHIIVDPAGFLVPYGVDASSDDVNLIGMWVLDPASDIVTAGVVLSSYSAITHSTISVHSATGVWFPAGSQYDTVSFSSITGNGQPSLSLNGQNAMVSQDFVSNGSTNAVVMGGGNNTISLSTMTSLASSYYALAIVGNAAFNNVNQSYMFNPVGNALGLLNTSNNNSISQSGLYTNGTGADALRVDGYANSFTSDQIVVGAAPAGYGAHFHAGSEGNTISQSNLQSYGSAAFPLFISGSSSNTITQSFISNLGGEAVVMSGDSYNTISQSTVTGGGGIFPAIGLIGSSDTIDMSYVQGAPALTINGSTSTVIDGSVLVTTKTFVFVSQASVGLTLTTNTFVGGTIVGINLATNNMGLLTITSNTITGGANGLWISTQAAGATLSISSLTFSNLTPGATAILFLGGVFNSTFSGVAFDNSVGVNVNASAMTGSVITMNPFSGPKVGPQFSNDPFSEVFWPGFTAAGLPGGCSSGYFVKQGGGADYTTIMGAVTHLPTSLAGGDACVVISDTQTYNEQVTISGFTNNGHLIKIMRDPTFVSSAPVVSPPSSSNAFTITNASVTLTGFNIVPTNSENYGVNASSDYVTISSVNVIDPNGLILFGGISLSSFSFVFNSSITVRGTHAMAVVGSYDLIADSTMSVVPVLSGGAVVLLGANWDTFIRSRIIGWGAAALSLTTASSNTFTQCNISNGNGGGAILGPSANNNNFNNSSITSGALGSIAMSFVGASQNAVTNSIVSNPVGTGLEMDAPSNYNTVSQSTITSNSPTSAALYLADSSNTVTLSYIGNSLSTAAYLYSGTVNNTISQSTITSNSAATALVIDDASYNTVTGDFISNASGDAVYLFPGSANNTISQSSITSGGAGSTALTIDGSSSNIITQTYLSAPAGFAAYLNAGASGNSISVSSMTSGSATYGTLVFDGVSTNTVSQCYVHGSGAGGAVSLISGANYVTISNSVVTSSGATADALTFDTNASYNTLTQSLVFNGNGNAVALYWNAFNNTISFSTMSSNDPTDFGLFMLGAASNTISNSYVFDPTGAAASIDDSNFNSISQTTIVDNDGGPSIDFVVGATSNTINLSYLTGAIFTGDSYNTISQSTMTCWGGACVALDVSASSWSRVTQSYIGGSVDVYNSTGADINKTVVYAPGATGIWVSGNAGIIKLSSDTVAGANIGLQVGAQIPGASLAFSSITFGNLTAGATAVQFTGGVFVSTLNLFNFADTSIAINVDASGIAGSTITMANYNGPRAGPLFSHDPFGEVIWPGAIFGKSFYFGVLATSGTVHTSLYYAGSSTQVASVSAPFGAVVPYIFSNVPAGVYNIRGYIDQNFNGSTDLGEPRGLSPSAGFGFSGSGAASVNYNICDSRSISFGQTINATITPADCPEPDQNNAFSRFYTFPGTAGQLVSPEADAVNFNDIPLKLYDSSGTLIASDDGGAGNGNSHLVNFALPANGVYTIGVSPFNASITSATFKLTLNQALGVIQGTVTYSGAQGGKVLAGLFTSPVTSSTGTPVQFVTLPGPGPFTFNAVPSGANYYIAAFIDVNGNTHPDPGEDFGVYGGTNAPTQVFVPVAGSSTGISFAIPPASTATYANVTGSLTYTGPSTGALHVELWGNSTFSGQPVAAINFGVVTTTVNFTYSVPAPGGVPYYVRGWLDLSGSLSFAASDPSGVYAPLNQGAQQVFAPVAGSTTNINFSIRDAGFSTNGFAGEGSASMTPLTAPAGAAPFVMYSTYTAGLHGLVAGGSLGFTFPPGFAPPLPPPTGAFMTVTSTMGITFSISTSAVAILVTVNGGVALGQQVVLNYTNGAVSCIASTATFTVSEAQNNLVAPAPLLSGAPSLQVVPGAAAFLRPSNLSLSLTQGVLSDPQNFLAYDVCGNVTTVSAASTATLSGVVFSVAQSTFVPDSSVSFATATTITPTSPLSLTFAVGQSSAPFYAIATSSGVKNIKAINYLGASATYYFGLPVLPSNALTGVAVSNAAGSLGQSSTTIVPNGGATSIAYINFNLGDPKQSWDVMISSVPFKVGVAPSPLWETWGSGQPNLGQVAWDGRYSPSLNGGVRVPSGSYYVRIEVAGGGVHDDSLIVVVAVPQIAGQTFDGSGGTAPYPPLPSANITLYGSNGSFAAASDAGGNYVVPGLVAGVYSMFVTRTDFLDGSLSVTVGGAGTVSTFTALTAGISGSTNAAGGLDIAMTRAATLFVVPSLSVTYSTQSADQYGTLQVRTSTNIAVNLQNAISLPLHLAASTTTFDDGGQFDPSVGQSIIHTQFKFTLSPGTYTVTAQMPNFTISSASVFVPAGVSGVSLPPLSPQSSISGLVTIGAGLNLNGTFVSVSAVPLSTAAAAAGGGGGVLVPGSAVGAVTSSSYTVGNLAPGLYVLRAGGNGLLSVSSGPILVPVSSAVTHADMPAIGGGAAISGTITITPVTAQLPVSVNAWSPGANSFGSTVVYVVGGGGPINYNIAGLISGSTYQVYLNIIGGNGGLQVAGTQPASIPAPSAVSNFTFAANTGSIAVTFDIPAPAVDFANVSVTRQTVASVNPQDVGNQVSFANATTIPGFAIVAGSTASFTLTGLNNETDDLSLSYATTGQSRKLRVSAVNGFATTAFVDLSSPTFIISGSINDLATNALFNTPPNIVLNAPNNVPSGYPGTFPATSARVEAILQNLSDFSVAISTKFDPFTSRVGALTGAGTFSISSVPAGAYYVRTVGLAFCTTCSVLVPSVGQLVNVSTSNVPGITLTLTDGFSISGSISLENNLSDARVFNVTVTDSKQSVVASSAAYLGDSNLNLAANSVNYSFSNLPANGFYTLSVVDAGSPSKYTGQPLSFPNAGLSPGGLQSSLTGQNVVMQKGAFITGRIRDANTGQFIGATNAGLLTPNFQITATADPWVSGGYAAAVSSVAGRPIQADGTFLVGPLLPGITYDLKLSQLTWDPSFLANGSQNYVPVTLASLQPNPVLDVGVISLNQGQSLSGDVYASTTTGAKLGNILVTAQPSFGTSGVTVQTYTNQNGHYNLWVSTFISNEYDVTAAPRGGNLASNGTSYTEVTRYSVNLLATTTADFVLNPLIASVTGQVLVADAATGGQLGYPFGAQKGFPAAAVFMQSTGTVATLNPFGDISAITDAQGNFTVLGLSTGTYSLRVVSLGYAVFNATVTASTSSVIMYTGNFAPANYLPGNVITLQRGATVTGRIVKSDGSAPNNSDVGGVAAANFAAGEFLVGSVNVDPVAKTVNSYSISGFKTGITYDLVILPASETDDTVYPAEGASLSFSAAQSTATRNINLTYSPPLMQCAASSKSLGNSQFQVKISCNKDLRNKIDADNDLTQILTLSPVTSAGAAVVAPNGTGVLDPTTKVISADRRQITVVYRAAPTEANFSLRLRGTASTINPQNGSNFTIDQIFDFFVGLNSNATQRVGNINGGTITLPPSFLDELLGNSTSSIQVGNENSRIDLKPGTFALCVDAACATDGVASATPTITVGISKGVDLQSATKAAMLSLGYVPSGISILGNPAAYPSDLAAAMSKYRALTASSNTVGGADPLSAFYSIFLPAGIRHQLKQQADITFSYSTKLSTSTSPDNINVYFYNATLGAFVQENTNRRLDTVNQTITVSVNHFSVFVVLDGLPVATGANPFNRPEIVAANFPNPSDCIVHTNPATLLKNTLFSPGGGSFQPFEGPMIRYSLPESGVVSGATIRIFSLSGELVRSMAQGDLSGGFTYYTPWNCTNGSGRRVASGVYIGDIEWNGKHKQFKMAIIKGSGL